MKFWLADIFFLSIHITKRFSSNHKILEKQYLYTSLRHNEHGICITQSNYLISKSTNRTTVCQEPRKYNEGVKPKYFARRINPYLVLADWNQKKKLARGLKEGTTIGDQNIACIHGLNERYHRNSKHKKTTPHHTTEHGVAMVGKR